MDSFRLTRRTFLGLGGAALAWGTSRLTEAGGRRPFPITAAPGLTGEVILPGSPEYADARLTFNSRFSRFPAVIVRCASTDDVRNAVHWARQHDLPLRARSGGHSYEGYSVVDGGVVIDVSGLDGISIDLAAGEAVVGAAVRLADLYRQLWSNGVTIPAGTCPLVGIAGLTLGGGIGFLSRQHGLTCDNLVAVELVDANGDVLLASDSENADLFWALRGGGGGNFGVVTSFTFRVHPIGRVATVTLSWPRDRMAAVIDAWQDWAPFVDERLTAGLVVAREGDVTSFGVYNGPETDLDSLLAPLLAAVPPQTSTAGSSNYVDLLIPPGTPAPHATFKNSSALAYAPLDAAAIDTLVTHLNQPLPPGVNLVQFFPFGGAIAAVPPSATAFVHRRALCDLQYQAYWWDPAHEAAHVEWVRAIRTAMLPAMRGAYVNYIDADVTDWASDYYLSNLPRLKRVKAAYDPDNVFDGPQSIPLS